jgi:hypothetical protein
MNSNHLYFVISFNHNNIHYEYFFQPTDYLPDQSLKTEILRDLISHLQPFSNYTPPETIYDRPLRECEISPILEKFDLQLNAGFCNSFERENTTRWISYPIPYAFDKCIFGELKELLEEREEIRSMIEQEMREAALDEKIEREILIEELEKEIEEDDGEYKKLLEEDRKYHYFNDYEDEDDF